MHYFALHFFLIPSGEELPYLECPESYTVIGQTLNSTHDLFSGVDYSNGSDFIWASQSYRVQATSRRADYEVMFTVIANNHKHRYAEACVFTVSIEGKIFSDAE